MNNIMSLRDELQMAREANEAVIEDEIREIGFECRGCGDCCRRDVEVVVFPGDIRAIMGAKGLDWLDVAGPNPIGDEDCSGRYRAFEWVLRRRTNGECIFYESGCRIYEHRPLLCRTYPFYIHDGALGVSECPSVGDGGCPTGLARDLKRRWIREIEEAIGLLERFETYCIARRGVPLSGHNRVVVYDSEGAHILMWNGKEYIFTSH